MYSQVQVATDTDMCTWKHSAAVCSYKFNLLVDYMVATWKFMLIVDIVIVIVIYFIS